MNDVMANGTGQLILVVDDNPVNVDLLSRRLVRDGYRVETRDTAVMLEAAIELTRPDVILLDWMMPDRSGLEALIAIRAIHDANRMPVIMVTAHDESEAISVAIEAGANDHVAKPIDFGVLRSRLAGVIARRDDMLKQDALASELEALIQQRTTELRQTNQMLLQEISERRAAESRANQVARTDSLTGLPNRFAFHERLRELAMQDSETAEPFSMLQIDIDRFRSINAVHGPETGDSVLKEVAQRMALLCASCDLVARTAPDEFSVLRRPGDGTIHLKDFASELHAALSTPMHACDRQIALSVSVAVVESGPLPCNQSVMLLECDAALRCAKKDGGGRIYWFDEELDEAIRENVIIKADLAAGIPRGEIVPHFQPTLSFISGEVEGAEVLARWHHPSRGLVSPAVFIPAAEETGQVDDLFWALLPRSCEEALRVSSSLRIAVNLSPSQVLDQWFPQKVLRALAESGFPPNRFEIEMTETALFADLKATKTALESLRNQGVGVALDDFGVGFSSLSLLRELPITKVKIDRSFVAEILREPTSASLVQGVIDLCKTLNLLVTAEGIEEEEIAVKLADWGCDYGQGYWLGRPAATLVTETPWSSRERRQAA